MPEFKVIYKHLKSNFTDSSVVLGVGDDAAVLDVPSGYQIVQTMDTMVLDIHFDSRFSADALAHKLLHVNLSDIAAMGAEAKWATVSLTMPTLDENWLAEFSQGLSKRCRSFNINLVGGDTTSGPLSVTMNLTGLVKQGSFLTRSGALDGEDIYVSGFLGDAALALTDKGKDNPVLMRRLFFPEARYQLGQSLIGIASSCIDLSDGLLQDLGHICRASCVSAQVNVEKLALSESYLEYFVKLKEEVNPDFALNGGDDFELCFTASPNKRDQINAISKGLEFPISRIGKIQSPDDLSEVTCMFQSQLYQCQRQGWEHFQVEK